MQSVTTFVVVTHNRYPSEEVAMMVAMSLVEAKMAAHRLVLPNASLLDLRTQSIFVKSSGYSASVKATISRTHIN